jgi:hypothetical protein
MLSTLLPTTIITLLSWTTSSPRLLPTSSSTVTLTILHYRRSRARVRGLLELMLVVITMIRKPRPKTSLTFPVGQMKTLRISVTSGVLAALVEMDGDLILRISFLCTIWETTAVSKRWSERVSRLLDVKSKETSVRLTNSDILQASNHKPPPKSSILEVKGCRMIEKVVAVTMVYIVA